MLKSVTFEVTGNQKIVCEGCEERVETLLKGVQGVSKVRAHSRNQRVDVLLNTAVLVPAAIVERLNKAGFEAKIATAA
jgi:copper chaperone